VAQFTQCLGFNLADALSGDIKFFPYFFQGSAAPVLKTEPELEHSLLTWSEGIEHVLNLLLQELFGGGINRW